METERKTIMVSARLPAAIVDRVDFIGRNIDNETIKGRSTAILAALEAWIPTQEDRLRQLGILEKKAR